MGLNSTLAACSGVPNNPLRNNELGLEDQQERKTPHLFTHYTSNLRSKIRKQLDIFWNIHIYILAES